MVIRSMTVYPRANDHPGRRERDPEEEPLTTVQAHTSARNETAIQYTPNQASPQRD